jgi:hypothetical protein
MARKSIITSAQETVVAAGKTAAKGTKTLVGELAHAAATTATAAPGAVWNKVTTTIGAKKPSSRTKKKVAKKVASKKRTTLKRKPTKESVPQVAKKTTLNAPDELASFAFAPLHHFGRHWVTRTYANHRRNYLPMSCPCWVLLRTQQSAPHGECSVAFSTAEM